MSMVSRETERRSLWRLNGEEYRQALAQMIARFGDAELANENGIYLQVEMVSIPAPVSLKAKMKIEIAQGADQNWRFGLNYSFPKGGGGYLPSVFGDGYSSRDECINAGIEELIACFQRDKEYMKAIPCLKAFQAQSVQLSLF